MANTVGAIACHIVRGTALPARQRVALWHRPGIDSPGAHLLGLAAMFEFVVVHFGSHAVLLAKAIAIGALQGTVVSITNGVPAVFANLLITDVQGGRESIHAALSVYGGFRMELVIRGHRT